MRISIQYYSIKFACHFNMRYYNFYSNSVRDCVSGPKKISVLVYRIEYKFTPKYLSTKLHFDRI